MGLAQKTCIGIKVVFWELNPPLTSDQRKNVVTDELYIQTESHPTKEYLNDNKYSEQNGNFNDAD